MCRLLNPVLLEAPNDPMPLQSWAENENLRGNVCTGREVPLTMSVPVEDAIAE